MVQLLEIDIKCIINNVYFFNIVLEVENWDIVLYMVSLEFNLR